MEGICRDLLTECEALAVLAGSLTEGQWGMKTPFYDWTPWDEIAHLCLFDMTGLMAVEDPEAFRRDAAGILEKMAAGWDLADFHRERFQGVGGPEILARWRDNNRRLVAALAGRGPKDRLPWYGPPMSALSFATARLMETWAHGQDIYDALGLRRAPTNRLRHIAHLGVTTFRWSFMNRGLPVPPREPYVELAAPDGDTWRWGEPSGEEWIRGQAEDFCLVVTQRRHAADTSLAHGGEGTAAWLKIAQCFAGPPADGPAPGERKTSP